MDVRLGVKLLDGETIYSEFSSTVTKMWVETKG